MRHLFNHDLITSFALYIDHQLCDGAQAYVNVSGGLYRMEGQSVSGYAYASPYKSWVADSCVSGAHIPSGVYNSSGQFLTRSSGIVFDFVDGRVISSRNWPGALTGAYARKEFNVYTSTEGQIQWWLDEVYQANPNIPYGITGISETPLVAPCVILTNAREQNDPFALGGLDQTRNTLRAYIISKGTYLQEGINSYFRDLAREYLPLATYGRAPYTTSGDLKGGYYCYTDFCSQFGPAGVWIEDVHNIRLNQAANNATAYMISISEFDLNTVRMPRTNK